MTKDQLSDTITLDSHLTPEIKCELLTLLTKSWNNSDVFECFDELRSSTVSLRRAEEKLHSLTKQCKEIDELTKLADSRMTEANSDCIEEVWDRR